MAGARKAWWRHGRWLAALAAFCLVLVPMLFAMDPVAAKAAPATTVAVHVHADGAVHYHADKSHRAAKTADADAGKSHAGCTDGCCLGKGCPLCSLAIGEGQDFHFWRPSVGYIALTTADTSGVAPPPPSEPPRL
jgi:4-amino-4-deoxy-L-arabinose transferase-like glycosyltransferase